MTRRWRGGQPPRPVLWLRQRSRSYRTSQQHLQEPLRRRYDEHPRTLTQWGHRFAWWKAFALLGLLAAFWVLFSAVMLVLGWFDFQPVHLQKFCSGDNPNDFYCDQVKSFLGILVPAALLTLAFVVLVYFRLCRRYRRRTLKEPHRIIPTAGRGIDRIVGRDELCRLLFQRLRDRQDQRPLVLVGGVGTGKTVTLLCLATLLARKWVLPVGIDLSTVDSGTTLDFRSLARKRLEEVIDPWLWSGNGADRFWRYLLREKRIAVLADGLDEARPHDPEGDRDSAIRTAVQQAIDAELPLVIASRPHHPLRGLNAFLLQLEPLGEGAAMNYVMPRSSAEPGWERIIRLVREADIADSPAYLPVIRDLRESGGLPEVADDLVDRVYSDRTAFRWHLMQHWCRALVEGHVREDYDLPEQSRADAIELLSALAVVGLARGSTSVGITDLRLPDDDAPVGASQDRTPLLLPVGQLRTAMVAVRQTLGEVGAPGGAEQDGPDMAALRRCLRRALLTRLYRLNPANRSDLDLATTTGHELGIVIRQDDRVRFQHGVIQAFLAARLLDAVLPPFDSVPPEHPDRDSQWFLSLAFRHGPSRELLAALTLFSRSISFADRARPTKDTQIADLLRDTAADLSSRVHAGPSRVKIFRGDRTKAVEMFATALDIDSRLARSGHRKLMYEIARRWDDLHEDHTVTDRPLEEAKQVLVRRFGAAAELLLARQRDGEPDLPEPECQLFFQMVQVSSYRIRLMAVREIARLGPGPVRWLPGRSESTPPTGPVAHPGPPDRPALSTRPAEERQMLAWLAPLRCIHAGTDAYSGSHGEADADSGPQSGADAGGDDHKAAWRNLRSWLDLLEQDDTDDRIVDEMNLAQGFRLAANCRYPEKESADRLRLVEYAETALRHSRFWYSQLALLQALTLLSLPDDPRHRLPPDGPTTDPRGLVDFWLSIAGGGTDAPAPDRPAVHPFVRRTADLCAQALLGGHPERHLWIDEQDVVRRIGSYNPDAEIRRHQDSWCPEAVGWMVLTRQAQRLLADVMLLLNLADRLDTPQPERAHRLVQANRRDLPPCLTLDPTPMQPGRNFHAGRPAEPGSTCPSDCPYRLCPLPSQRTGLAYPMDEVFCARQIDLAGPWWRRMGTSYSWLTSRRRIHRFWRDLSQRMVPSWRR
ncbi:hypothetical protein O7626_06985 [Micromonospora sp. WMMD1102]|uniref:hypothetical protein n=1 Tax=Micromonospora sp. WMMD1102 TaxID=3016105 RepID=UPI002414E974|nr:hypothetical protein [Micromonospora sp. WMMD1102]MDG4785677.1 hypothetical protein [Micromonospora sp. WMMD1102]